MADIKQKKITSHHRKGLGWGQATITDETRKAVNKARWQDGKKTRQIAEEFGISLSSVCKITNGGVR